MALFRLSSFRGLRPKAAPLFSQLILSKEANRCTTTLRPKSYTLNPIVPTTFQSAGKQKKQVYQPLNPKP